MPLAGRDPWLSIAPIAEIAAPITACWCSCSSSPRERWRHPSSTGSPPTRLRRAPAWDCGFPDLQPGDAIHRRKLQPTDPARVRRLCLPRRERLDMPAPGETRPAVHQLVLRDPVWDGFYTPLGEIVGAIATRLNRLPVPHHPAVPQRRLRRAGRAAADSGGLAMTGLAVDLVFQLMQMTLVILIAPLLTGLVRAVKARLTRSPRPAAVAALSRSRAGSCARRRWSPTARRGCSARRPMSFGRHLGRRGADPDLRHWAAVFLVGRSDRHRRAAWLGPLLLALAGLDVGTSFAASAQAAKRCSPRSPSRR